MDRLKTHQRVTLLFYLLAIYVVLQFAWWAYLLIDLSKEHYAPEGPETVGMKIGMIAGEGAVFMVFLMAGIFIMRRAIMREIDLARQQRNFLLSITHELKTPLAGIKLALQTLEKRSNLNPDKRRDIETVAMNNTNRLHALIDNVLMATRIESGKSTVNRSEVDVSAATKVLVDQAKLGGSEGQVIDADIAPGIVCHTDPQAYASIVGNLLENAVKYGGGKPVLLELSGREGRILLTISDRGPGIPEPEATRVFDMFYRLGNEETRNNKGTGLGLYIVRELTSALGGEIKLESAKGGGARFQVILPCGG